jgi:hypothetical protein
MPWVLAPWVLRISYPLVLGGWRMVQGPGIDQVQREAEKIRGRLQDPGESDEDLHVALSDATGYDVGVATFSEPFELRKLVMLFTQLDGATLSDDQRACSLHLLKLAAGSPQSDWVQADFDAVVAEVDQLWTGLQALYANETRLDRIKLYKAGPAIEPPQPPVYEVDKDVTGTDAASPMPPQVAVSVTFIAGTKAHWGRLYLPAPGAAQGGQYGRLSSATQTTIATAFDTFLTDLRAAGLSPVVYRRELPEREKKNGTVLPARAASAWEISKVQVDDVFDVIRSRRWKNPALRVQRDI